MAVALTVIVNDYRQSISGLFRDRNIDGEATEKWKTEEDGGPRREETIMMVEIDEHTRQIVLTDEAQRYRVTLSPAVARALGSWWAGREN